MLARPSTSLISWRADFFFLFFDMFRSSDNHDSFEKGQVGYQVGRTVKLLKTPNQRGREAEKESMSALDRYWGRSQVRVLSEHVRE